MKLKPRARGLVWVAAGAAGLLVLMLLALHYGSDRSRIVELNAKKVNLVESMRYSLVAASEAEKSAVLAITDPDSQTFADQARAATAEVERLRTTLDGLLAAGASQKERQLLAAFSVDFADYQRIDHELLALAVKNTNLKATALAFGPAAQAAGDVDAALSRFLATHATSPQRALLLAASAQSATLRLETRLAPHIAEESDKKMNDLEALMATDDRQVREALDGLAALPELRDDPDLATARSSFTRFGEVRTQILALSRENTNVRSLAISLDQKRKAMAVCQDDLNALQQAIAAEPTPPAPVNPRQLGDRPASS